MAILVTTERKAGSLDKRVKCETNAAESQTGIRKGTMGLGARKVVGTGVEVTGTSCGQNKASPEFPKLPPLFLLWGDRGVPGET